MIHLHDLDSNKVTCQSVPEEPLLSPPFLAARICPTSPFPDMGF